MATSTQSVGTDTTGVYVLTYNCARTPVSPSNFASHLFQSLSSPQTTSAPELLVLCLQELAPISYAFLGGSFLTPYFNAWREVVRLASKGGQGYVNIVSRNIGMTAIMVFVREDMAESVKWLRTACVGVGVSEMGNKGAVGVRLGYRDTQITFVAAHLAPMEDALERRNEDYKNIVRRLVFTPDTSSRIKPASRAEEEEDAPLLQEEPIDGGNEATSSNHGMYGANGYLFFAGDLNYRTSLLTPSPQDVAKRYPDPVVSDDEADARHWRHLFTEDQLSQQLKAGKTLHGLTEAPITFPPTYKYNVVSNSRKAVIVPEEENDRQDWSWARHRWPSWCDRIFFQKGARSLGEHERGGEDQLLDVKVRKYTALPLFATSDHRPVALSATVSLNLPARQRGGDDEAAGRIAPPFSIDPEWRNRRASARRKELVVGFGAYLTTTWEGNGLLIATMIGVIGGWLIVRSLLMS
jgi:hypothetical protein